MKSLKPKEITLAEFNECYMNKLAPQSFPDAMCDICQGWTQETFRQVIMTITRKGAAPIKLWYDSYEEMLAFSNKRDSCAKIFQIMDTNKVGRIDTMELFASILVSLLGKFETVI